MVSSSTNTVAEVVSTKRSTRGSSSSDRDFRPTELGSVSERTNLPVGTNTRRDPLPTTSD